MQQSKSVLGCKAAEVRTSGKSQYRTDVSPANGSQTVIPQQDMLSNEKIKPIP